VVLRNAHVHSIDAPAPLLALTLTSPGAARAAQSQGPRVIEISAERFEFWPSEVTVAEGEEVELRLRSDDTIHGFRIIGTGTNLAIPKRGKGYATARFVGMVPGRYTFECNGCAAPVTTSCVGC
jgi:plastocyanin